MSWLARSIANTLHLDDQDDDDAAAAARRSHQPGDSLSEDQDDAFCAQDPRLMDSDDDEIYGYKYGGERDLDGVSGNNQGRGVKEDLSELKDTLTRQFWGVASFLAPPPPPPPPPPTHCRKLGFFRSQSNSDWAGSDNDGEEEEEKEEEDELVEYDESVSGQFGEFSNFSQLEDYSVNVVEDAIGITEEVLAFARNIAHHPETWLDFPLSEEEEIDDFDISDAQYKHALAVEQLAPRLAALRIELCPAHMSEGYFWTVYFVLLHSRLNKHDADLLSTPQIVQTRAIWMQELQKKTKDKSYLFGGSSFRLKESADLVHENSMNSYEDISYRHMFDRMSPYDPSTPSGKNESETEKLPFSETEYIDKSAVGEDQAPKPVEKDVIVGSSNEIPTQDDNYDDDDDWLKEDSDLIGYSSSMIMGNEEDVSFSDLEDDIDCTMPVKSKIVSDH